MTPPVPGRLRAVAEVFSHLFEVDPGAPYCIRRSQVSRAVAAGLGVGWSPRLGREVQAIAVAAGARLSVIRVEVYRGIRPKSLTPSVAMLKSTAFCRTIKQTAMDAPLREAARAAVRSK